MTKKLLNTLIAGLLAGLFFTSCGEDRRKEYYALVGTQMWIYDTMQKNYLFYEDLPVEDENMNFFTKPQEFLSKLISPKDQKNGAKFSHIDSVYVETKSRATQYPNFGFEGSIVRVPNGSEAIRVLYIQEDSPAQEAKLKRGDWIIAADGKKINSNSYANYVSRPRQACTFTLGSFNGLRFDTLQVIEMPAPRMVEQHNLLEAHLITSGSRKAAYILYNEFGQDEKQLRAFFAQLAGQQFDDVILDLRYNPGGYVSTSQVLTTNLAPEEALNQPFLKMTTNDLINQTEVYTLDPELLGGALPANYQNLYIITSGGTASASEILINGLRPYLKNRLIQVGTATFGKNLAQSVFTDESAPQVELWLTTHSLANSEDFGDYFTNGLPPDYTIAENMSGELGALGTPQDSLLLPILHHMANGSFPNAPTEETKASRRSGFKVVYDPILSHPKPNKLGRK